MARSTLAAALAALLLHAALLNADDAPKGDKDLDGDWKEVATVLDGKELKPPPEAKIQLTTHGRCGTSLPPAR